jgi:mono/diheme cytochrome c family protein
MIPIRSLLCSLALVFPLTLLSAPEAGAQSNLGGGIAATGKAIAEAWCSACHLVGPTTSGQQASADAPPFSVVAQRLPTEIDVLAAFIANPHPPMPNLSLSRQDVRDLLAYIATLR